MIPSDAGIDAGVDAGVNDAGDEDAGSVDSGTTDAGSDAGLDAGPTIVLVGLSVAPTSVALVADTRIAPATQAFTATGHYDGGPDQDLSATSTWSLDRAVLGSIDGGLFTTARAAGQGTVTASIGGLSATATVDVTLLATVITSGTPSNAESILPANGASTITSGSSPTVIYPSGGTVIPVNFYKTTFFWNGGTGNDLFRLELKGRAVTLNVYTALPQWTATPEQWAWLADSAAGETLTLTIYGVATATPANVYRSTAMNLVLSQKPIDGAIYYWSTTSAGTHRAWINDDPPQDVLGPANTGKCVACHTVSRDGTRIAAAVGGDVLGVYDATTLNPVISPSQNVASTWATFSPDNTKLVTARAGILTLRDAATGASAGMISLPGGRFGTNPDWSPDGTKLAFTYSASNRDRGVSGSSIATLEYANGAFSNLRILVQSTGATDTSSYPRFSPDSRWIAFSRSLAGNNQNNDLTRLFLVAADGTGSAVELTRANVVVNNATLSGSAAQLNNVMPTWAPGEPDAGDWSFLMFSSHRAYANVYAAGGRNQLWVAGVDLAHFSGSDPSAAAFRLPFQSLATDNHLAFWSTAARPDAGFFVADGGTNCIANIGSDCSTGPCCAPNFCASTAGSSPYTCQTLIGKAAP